MGHNWQSMLRNGLDSLTETSSDSGRPQMVEGERRRVAALFLDLKDFTSLSESMDHEAVHGLVGGVMKVLVSVVDSHGGYVDKIEGDRIMALFGATYSAENDSIRAVSCAISMLRTIRSASEFLSDHGIGISARAGIACGPVTVAPDALGHLTATGDTVNLASRLESRAREGTVLVSGRIYRQCGDFFQWENCGRVSIRGRTRTVQTWRPLGPGSAQKDRWKTAASVSVMPFTGRGKEMDELAQLLQLQKSGKTGLNRFGGRRHIAVHVCGSAGIGKSRLVSEFLSGIENEEVTVLRGYSRAFAQPPYTLWSSVLRNLLGLTTDSAEEGSGFRKRIDDLVGSIFTDEEEGPPVSIADNLFTLLSMETSGRGFDESGGESIKLDLMTSFRDLFRAMGRRGRLAVVLENYHNADSASREMLRFIVENCHMDTPAVFLCLSREGGDETDTFSTDYCDCHTCRLAPLNDGECRSLIKETVGQDLTREAQDWLVRRIAGNPFYMKELLGYLVDSGRLDEAGGIWKLSDSFEYMVPDSLTGLIRYRIDRMPPDQKNLLQFCSVLGPDFSLDHYREFHRRMKLPGDPLEELAVLVERGFLEKYSDAGETMLRFCNPLVCDSAYDTLLFQNRRVLHKMAAETAADLAGDHPGAIVPLVAHHWMRAGVTHQAVRWGMMALDLYSSTFRHDEVTRLSESLQKWISRWDDENSNRMLIEILLKYERSLAIRGRTGVRWKVLDRLMELTEQAECFEYRPRVQSRYGVFYYSTGNRDKADEIYRKALSGAVESGDMPLQAELQNRLGTLAQKRGEIKAAGDYLEKALENARDTNERAIEGDVLTALGTLSLNIGETSDALESYRRALALAESEDIRTMKVNVLANMAMTFSLMEDAKRALDHYRKALDQSREIGNRGAEGTILGNMGILLQNNGRMDEALDCFETA
ncbi:MAG: tetratricopeptide repeat protein, partial [Candidatus Aegiribacteria sp.]|nr:tetratricopeptide repeat protein [Candidatus Aegiribacteria sp.]MBD3294598.1 tetratricopeptide repeat protein [Candidatus Fermentibacteria bacterium]